MIIIITDDGKEKMLLKPIWSILADTKVPGRVSILPIKTGKGLFRGAYRQAAELVRDQAVSLINKGVGTDEVSKRLNIPQAAARAFKAHITMGTYRSSLNLRRQDGMAVMEFIAGIIAEMKPGKVVVLPPARGRAIFLSPTAERKVRGEGARVGDFIIVAGDTVLRIPQKLYLKCLRQKN